MKCLRQLPFYRLPIANIWEVKLEKEVWERVCKVAKERQCTFSWVTRYCVFRLARKKNLIMRPAMENHSCKIKKIYQGQKKLHRHMLCLYGDDEMLIRLAALRLGVTVSHLIRISLYWFLPKIESRQVTWPQIFYHGTKICRFIDTTRTNMLQMPFYETLFYGKWPQEKWWKRPRPAVTIPYTPEFAESQIPDT